MENHFRDYMAYAKLSPRSSRTLSMGAMDEKKTGAVTL